MVADWSAADDRNFEMRLTRAVPLLLDALAKPESSTLHTTGGATAWANPALSFLVRGQGLQGWFGWWSSPRAEELAKARLFSNDSARQAALAGEMGRHALEEAAFLPLGQFRIRTAFRRDLTGMLEVSSPYPWNLRRG